MPYLAPSILSADLTCLADQIRIVEEQGADFIHIDVMDGHFVPNLTFGPVIVEAVKRITKLPLDVHLMVKNPMQFLDWFAAAGAHYITVHQEACLHLDRAMNHIKNLGCKAGVSLNPATPVQSILHLLESVDLVLIMSVNPGFGGQSFIPYTLTKIRELHEYRQSRKTNFLIEVDGGINEETAESALKAGADVLVAGNSIFNSHSIADSCAELKSIIVKNGGKV
ncbi:MAG: ribulose-phosphate 3-epimerase [Calditrichaeota bacterium]|nr:ribulose-phosphate 3-epimerase [Calditrichota bacterium]